MGSKDLKSVSASCRDEIGKGIKKLKGMFGSIRLPQTARSEKEMFEERSLLDDIPAVYPRQEAKKTMPARMHRDLRTDELSDNAAHTDSAPAEDTGSRGVRCDPLFLGLDCEELDVTDLMQQDCEDPPNVHVRTETADGTGDHTVREVPVSAAADTVEHIRHRPEPPCTDADEVEYCDFLPPMSHGERRAPGARTASVVIVPNAASASGTDTAHENAAPMHDHTVSEADVSAAPYLEIRESEIFESEMPGSAENTPLYLEVRESEVFESKISGTAEAVMPLYLEIDGSEVTEAADHSLPYLEIHGSEIFESGILGSDECVAIPALGISEVLGTDMPYVLAQNNDHMISEYVISAAAADTVPEEDFAGMVSADQVCAEDYVPNFVLVCDHDEVNECAPSCIPDERSCGGGCAGLDTMLPDDAVRQFDREDRVTPPELDMDVYDECEDGDDHISVKAAEPAPRRSGITFDFVSPAPDGSPLNFKWGCGEAKTETESAEETPIYAAL